MRELTIAQCKELESGEPIPSFRGRITKVYEQKSGDGQFGTWWMQNMIVEDSTDKVQVTWGGEDDLSELEGQTRLFECSQSTKHGLTGIKWDVRSSGGKTYSGIKLTTSCKIKPVNGADAKPTDHPPPTVQPAGAGVNEARQHIMRAANLHVLCVNAVNSVIAPNVPVIAQTAEFFQAAVASLFIEASSRRTTDGINWWSYVDRMPASPVQKEKASTMAQQPTKTEEIDNDEVPF